MYGEIDNMKKRGLPAAVELIIALAVTAAVVFFGAGMIYPLAAAAPAGAYIMARRGAGWGAAFAVLGAAVCWLMGADSLVVFVVLLPLMITAAVCVAKKVRAFTALMASSAAALAGVGLLVLIIYLATGKDVITYLVDSYAEELRTSDMSVWINYLAVRVESLMTSVADPQQLQEAMLGLMETPVTEMRQFLLADVQLNNVRINLSSTVPQMMVMTAVLAAMASYLGARAFTKRAGRDVAPLPKFSSFALPRSVAPYFVITYLLALLPELFGLDDFTLAAQLLMAIMSPVLLVQGMSLAYYFFEKWLRAKGLRVVLLIALTLLLTQILVILGLIEQVIRIRERLNNPQKQ